ncbi:MAG: tetratricopeptide repeat protein [Alphaproteobacteria bacterium]|nr:tetratricopeptide repeat protein [Alphaproteobacteria bacterium]
MSGTLSLDQALARAKREAERGHFDEATKTLKAILKAAPGQPQALQMLGMILQRGKMGVLYQADAVFLRKGSALVPDKVW